MQTADPEVLALCENWDMHCRRRLRQPRRRHRHRWHRWHRFKAVTETHPLAYPKWVIPAIFTLYYIFVLQISYTVNMIIWCIHIHIHIWCVFFSNETFQHQMIFMICLAFLEKHGGKARWHRKKVSVGSDVSKQAMGAPAAAGPTRDRERPLTGCRLWRLSSVVFSFSRSRMPTIWKSLLALQLQHANMHRFHASILKRNAFCAFGICQRFFFKKKEDICKICECKRCKRCIWSSEMRAMSPHSWHASFLLPSGFPSRLQVIPSQCQAFMASVARDWHRDKVWEFAEFRHCHRGAVSFNWLILFHRCIPCQDARSCDFLLTTKYVKMNLNNFLRTFFSLSSLFKFFNWSSLYVKFPSGSKKHSEEAKTPKSRTHRHKTSFSQHGFCDGVRTSVVFCLTLPVTLQWPCNGPRKQSLIFKYVLLK